MNFDFYVCPRKFKYAQDNAVTKISKNTEIKNLVIDGVKKIISDNISKDTFLQLVGKTIELGKAKKKIIDMEKIYDLVMKYRPYISTKKQIIKIAFTTPENYDTNVYYLIKQVTENNNEPMYFCTIVMKIEPTLQFYELAPQSEEIVLKIKSLEKSVDVMQAVTQEFYPCYNNIACSNCPYTYLCKPINIKEDVDNAD